MMKEKIQNIHKILSRSIFVGERLESNLHSMTVAGIIMMVMGLMMSILNVVQHQYIIAISPLLVFISALISLYYVHVRKQRKGAIIATMAVVFVVLTYDVLFADNGFAFLWTLLVPLTISYMFSVKIGILSTCYFQLLFVLAFYTPLRVIVADHYSETVMTRFPLLYFFNGLLTLYIMYQYHKSVLFEIDYANRLNEEVARQTAVAEERSRKLETMSFQTIQTLAHAIDAKDPYTKGHSTRVSRYSVKIAEALGWTPERINDLQYAALLHDIGKIGIPDSILNNPRRLSDVEYDIIKSHTTMGGEILKDKIMIGIADEVALSHHERYDGKGYPQGLKGEEIPEEARVVAIADAFDAMSSNRIYRKACDPAFIHQEMEKGSGKQFDPNYAGIFLNLWNSGALDPIMKDDAVLQGGELEESSALLQKVMDTFTNQSTSVDNEQTDINQLVNAIRTSGSYEGALDVEYRQFASLYEFIENLEKRFDHHFELIMITLQAAPGAFPHEEELERAMFFMEQSIRQTIRNVDVFTRYNRQQFLVILLGTEPAGVKIAVDRIFRGYYKMNGSSAFTPCYSVAERQERAV